MPGQIGITGPAGSCLINNTEIWHTNSPLTGDLPRRLIMILYKHAWMKQWQDGYETTPEFAARQTDPLRRQLTGDIAWHQDRPTSPPPTTKADTMTPEEKKQFLSQGYLHAPGVLTGDHLAQVQAEFDRVWDLPGQTISTSSSSTRLLSR